MIITGTFDKEDKDVVKCYLLKYPMIIDTLPPRESEVLKKMLESDDIEAIAKEYNVTRERIRQITSKAVSSVTKMYNRLLLKESDKTKWHNVVKNPADYAEYDKPAIVVERNIENGKVYIGFGVWNKSKHWNLVIHTPDFPNGELKNTGFEILAWRYIDTFEVEDVLNTI